MTFKFKSAIAVLAVTLGVGGLATAAQAQIFQDNSIEYRYGGNFAEPGTGTGITKNIVNFTHVSGDKWGGNFFTVDFLMSNPPDVVSGGTAGAQEVYGIYRRTFSYNKLTGASGGWGPIADFGLQVGGDANSKNDAFGAGKRLVVVGPYLAWKVPVGFLTTAFQACHEWNANNLPGAQRSVDFDTTFCFESAWSFPFKIASSSWRFSGFFNVVAPKGKDGFGAQTKTEVLTRPELMLDVGELAFGRKNFVEVGFAYEYWFNKFGNDNAAINGAIANTPMFVGKVHF